MKIAAKFLLVFILVMCGVLGVSASFQIRKEIKLYEEDTRKDHIALGQLLAQTARKVWKPILISID